MRSLREHRRALALRLYGGFYRCPTNNRIIESLPGDDKVLCRCMVPNPEHPSERTDETGVHVIRFLKSATVDEYLDQYEPIR